jgi:methyl-accepting chemotaxis protein
MTQTAAAQTEELSATAESMSQQARELEAMVSRFELGTGHGSANAAPVRTARVVPGSFQKPALHLAPRSHAAPRPVIAASAGGGGEEFEEL